MVTILQFRHSRVALQSAERALLDRLNGSVQVLWRGGWAEQGEPDGIILYKNQSCLGVWFQSNGRFAFTSIETGCVHLRCETVDAAYTATLDLLGPIPLD